MTLTMITIYKEHMNQTKNEMWSSGKECPDSLNSITLKTLTICILQQKLKITTQTPAVCRSSCKPSPLQLAQSIQANLVCSTTTRRG